MTQRRIYQNEYPYFVTFRTREGCPLFNETKYAELLSQIMFNACTLKRYDIILYQTMPDHVHLLTQGVISDYRNIKTERTLERVRSGNVEWFLSQTERTFSNVRSSIKKQYTISDLIQSIKGNFSRELHMGNIWQPRFYTRIINNRKYLETVIQYIKDNPIKEELPKKYHNPPYQYFDWNKINNLFFS